MPIAIAYLLTSIVALLKKKFHNSVEK